MAANKDVPGVIAPPPLIFLFFLLCGIAADRFLALELFPSTMDPWLRWFAGGAFVATAMLIMTFGIRNFRRAGTPVPTRAPTTALVTTGIHGLSRNPLYVGLYLFYAGFAILANSIAALVLMLPLAIVIRHGVVAREETYLERKFGDAYLAYKARVPRWM